MLISVLISNYNNENFLTKALDSIYCQTLDKLLFEIIVCDDCSTDNSLEKINEFIEILPMRILYNPKNLGVGFTKRRLISESKGHWFLFLDSDDYLENICLESLYNYIVLNSNNDVSMIYANSYKINRSGEIINWRRSKSFSGSLLDNKFQYPIFHPIIYSRRMYDQTDGIDENLKSADDFDLWYKMEEKGKIVHFNDTLYYYRENPNGVSQAKNNLNKWYQVMLEHAFCSALAARRRGLDQRKILNDFAELMYKKKLTKNKAKCFILKIFNL